MAATAGTVHYDVTRVNGSEGFDKELTQDLKDGHPTSISVVELKENEYLLPTAILCEHSPVIKDAILTQKGYSIPRIHIKGIDDNTFRVIVEFMRGNAAPVNVQNVVDVYHAACSLRMKPLEIVCWNKVFEKEPVERSLPAWIAAKRLNMPDEEKQLYRYITYNFDEIVKTDSFLELDASQVKEILRADVIKAEDELSLYKALMLWIHHDCKARHKYASTLVEAIRFQDMTPAQVEDFKALKVCPEVQKSFDVSNRIPQPGQQKTDRARQYAQAQKMESPYYGKPATAATVATPAAVTSVPRPMGLAATTLGTASPAFQAPEQLKADTATSVQAAPPPQKQLSEPVVLSLEQQQAVLSPLSPEVKSEVKGEKLDKKDEKDKRKGSVTAPEIKAEKKDAPKEPMPVQEPMKTEEGKKHETHKKRDSVDKPDSRGDKKAGRKHSLKDGAGETHKGKKEADALKSATSDAVTASTMPPNMSEPTSATTVPPSTVDSTPSKHKPKKEAKDKKPKSKKEGGKDKKKGKSAKPPKKKKSFCPWLGSKKGSKQSKQSIDKHKGKGKSKETGSKDAVGRSEGKGLEAGKGSKPKGKKSSSKEGSTRSRSKEKGSKEKAAKGSKEKAGSKEKSSKEGISKQKHSKEKHGSKEKRGDKDKHRSKDKHSKEKISKEKSSSKEGKKKDKSKKHAGSKSESKEAGGGGGAKKREAHGPSKKKEKASADAPGGESGGGGGKIRKAKHATSKSRKSESSSKRSHSSSSRAKSSGKSSATVPKRRPDKEKGRSDLALTTKKSDSGGGRAHRRTRSANRLSSAQGGSELSLVGGKSAFQTDRDKRRRRLSNVPHRARSDAAHASDLSVRGLEQNPADRQMVVALFGGLTVDSKGTTPENAAIYSFWPSDNKWKSTGKMPKPRYGHQAVIGAEHIYVVGGFEVPDNDERVRPTAVCHRFSLTRKCWEPMASLKHARCHHGVALLVGKVYAVGGQSTDGVFLDSVEVYDPAADHWAEATPLCCARIAANAVEFRDRMYVVGGLMVVPGHKRRVCIVPDTMCFEPKTDTWHHKGALPLAMCNCSLLVHAGRLLAVGGLVRRPGASASARHQPLTPVNGVLEYSPASDSWTTLSTLPAPLHSVCLASLGEEIYVLGGQLADDAATAVNAAYRYNPVTDRWTSLPPLPVRLSQACAVTVRQHTLGR